MLLNEKAAKQRATRKSYKNDTSSRSHAFVHLTMTNSKYPSMDPGELFIIDLAGAENCGDTQLKDKDLMKQTKDINKSLMALSECFRNRALFALDPSKSVHIPYRSSKLTLLLKDTLEI